MRLNYLFALLLVCAGVTLSLFLVPRSKELALQTFRDHEFEAARDAYLARFNDGDRGADTIMPLVGLSLDVGDVADAIRYLETYVALEPNQVESREMLGQLYLADERVGDFLANLEEIVRQRPTYDRVYELTSYYRFLGRFNKLEGALRKQVDVRPDDADAVQELAELQAARGARDEALATLAAFDDRDEGRKTPAAVRSLMTALLLEKGETEPALARADRWLRPDAATAEIIDMVGLLSGAGRPELAYRLLKPYEARAAGEEALALALVDVETALGRLDDARLRLSAWAARGPIADAVLGRFIGLANSAGLGEMALDAAKSRDLALIPEWALAGLADTAFRNRDRAFLDRLMTELGDGFLADRPILAAEIALARDDKAAARRWAMAALADATAPLIDRLAGVRMLTRLGAMGEAAQAFDRLPLAGDLPDDALADLGALFIELERPEAGFRWFAARRRERPSPGADIGWARLSARAGDPAAVVAWLEATPQVESWVLQDIAAAASQRGDEPGVGLLALKAAERAYALARTPETATVLAGAYLANNRAEEALALVRPLIELGGPAVEYIYAQALQALGRLEELAAFWTAKLATGVLDEKEADNLLFAMLGNKSYAAVLPYLKERAATRGGEWLFGYAEAARALGGEALDGLIDFLDGEVERADIDDAAREQRLFMMMEASRPAAVATLARLTERTPSRWWPLAVDNLRQMNRNDDLATFLEALIDRADIGRADREAMAYALIDAGGAARALPVIARLADEVGGAWDAVYRENLVKLGRIDELRVYLTLRAARPDLPVEDRRALVFALLELGDKPAAEKTLLSLADGQGPDGDDARQLYFLWGPRPGPAAMEWLERRARQAPSGAARAAWLVKMVELGGRDRALALMGAGDKPPADARLLPAFIEAKAAAKDADAMAAAIKTAARGETRPETLRRYARLAEQARRGDAASAAWAALLALRPDDADALRQLGMQAYDDQRNLDAERFLRRYVRRGGDDYEANYFLGEALTLLKRPAEAQPFYRTALAQLRGAKGLPQQARQTEAALLNRLGRVEEALALYDGLRRARPADRQIQAEYANMLIENRRWREARNVLAVP